MKLLKRLLILVVAGMVIFGSTASVQAQDGSESEEVIQVVLVLDVSQSMEELVPYGELPAELATILEEIDAIEKDEELVRIREEIDAIVNDPVVTPDLAQDTASEPTVDIVVETTPEVQEDTGSDVCVPSMEVCNGEDDDCNGEADDGLECGTCPDEEMVLIVRPRRTPTW